MTNENEVRDAQGKIIAIVNRRTLQAWLNFGTSDPSLSTLAANLHHARRMPPEEQPRVSLSSSMNTNWTGDDSFFGILGVSALFLKKNTLPAIADSVHKQIQ